MSISTDCAGPVIPTDRCRTTASVSFSTGKRKLEDFAPAAHGGDTDNLVTARMRKDDAVHQSASATAVAASTSWASPCQPPPFRTACSATPAWVQFFVRLIPDSKTMVIQANSSDKVVSILERIHERTGIPVSQQRLIYRGKHLEEDQSLADCSIHDDSNLHLVGLMRSTQQPKACRIIDDMISIVCRLCRGESVDYALKIIKTRLYDYLSMTTKDDNDNASGHLQIFLSSSAPSALVMLYMSPIEGNKKCAEECIKHFLDSTQTMLPKSLHSLCASIVLAFCNLLRRISPDEPLYSSCRSCLGSLLETVGVLRASENLDNIDRVISVEEIFPFVGELAARLSSDLVRNVESLTLAPLETDVHDFSAFLSHVLPAITKLFGYLISMPLPKKGPYHSMFFNEIQHLYLIFEGLLIKMDTCLAKMEECLADKLSGHSEMLYQRWSQYLPILKELNAISEHFVGLEERFSDVLRLRKHAICALILRYVKRNDGYDWLLGHKDVTNFECRRHLVMMLFPEIKEDYEEHHEMLIDRAQLLSESFEYVAQTEPEYLHAGLFMEFKNEEATGPGVLREWFFLVCQALFNQQNALFVACPNDRTRFYPNPASKVDPLHLDYFKFSGRMIALALMHKVQVGIVLDRVFFLQLGGQDISLEDIRDADPFLFSSSRQILEMDPEFIDSDALGLTFVREIEELGSRSIVDLCPGGRNIMVNSKNREEYVKLLVKHRFVTSISEQVSKFEEGFTDIISTGQRKDIFFQSIELEDLDLMLRGSGNDISVEDWKSHTEYNGYTETDPQIFWFWKIVGEMTAVQRQELLFFWMSVRHLPMEGFKGLASRLHIYRSQEPHCRLPTSHTCFFRLCFPPYPSLSIMRDRLRVIVQEHVGSSFGTW